MKNISVAVSPVKKTPMSLIGIVREEGTRLAKGHCGYRYIMTHIGTLNDFKEGRIHNITRRGCKGKITYKELRGNSEITEKDIVSMFNAWREKYKLIMPGTYRGKMYEEFKKMIANFNPSDYYAGRRISALSEDVQKHSIGKKPENPTTFCQAVARMMTLVRLAHKEGRTEERERMKEQQREEKKIANNKRCAKYNKMQSQMGVEKFNQMKARDQAAKEKRAAQKVSGPGMIGRTAKFVKWRTETDAGKKYDTYPRKAYVTPVRAVNSIVRPPIKQLGYTNSQHLARLLRRCLDNKYTDIYVRFNPDPNVASSQLYQYAPIYGSRPSQLRKTRDADTNRVFRVCGFLQSWSGDLEYYIQPDNENGTPMYGNVYYALPPQWKDYEMWTGFGIMGNPQNSTSMETLFKVVDNNITEVTFFTKGVRYRTGHSNVVSKSVDELLSGIKQIPSPAEAAAAAAEIEKKRRRDEARERERRFRTDSMKRMLGGEIKPEDPKIKAKVNLAIKLAQGDIDQTTFNAAMAALG